MTQGFANPGILAVACLFIVAEGLASTGAIDYFVGKLLGNPKTLGQALIRMMIPASFVAMWISSTAVVALLIPVLQRWAKKVNQPPSLLMMPMCYAVHLGGTVTLVGTTTNLVIAGLASTYYCRTMGIFELSTVGLPVCIAGLGCLLLISRKVLPSAQEYERRISNTISPNKHKRGCCMRFQAIFCRCFGTKKVRNPDMDNEDEMLIVEGTGPIPKLGDYVFHAIIPANSAFNEKSVEEAGLRQLNGLFLASVQRGNTLYSAVGPEFQLHSSDNLGFAGVPENFLPMCKQKGLIPLVEGEADEEAAAVSIDGADNPLSSFTTEAVVRSESDLIGKTMKEVGFRTRFNASTLAIHRAGDTVKADRLGTIPLKVGDILVLIINDQFDWNAPETRRDLKPRFDQLGSGLGTRRQSMENAQLADDGTSSAAGSSSVAGSLGGGFATGKRDYVFSMRVASSIRLQLVRPLNGLTLEQAGLRNIPGVRVIAVSRGTTVDRAVGPDFVLHAEDIVWFVGERDGLSSLRRVPGLEDTDSHQVKRLNLPTQSRRLVEVVVSLQSDLLYKTVRESRFRTRFNAAIVAVQRHGQRVLSKIGDIELEPGDVLIIDAGPDFAKRFKSDANFLVISEVDASAPPRMDRFYIAAFASLAMVVLTAATGIDLILFALFACGIMLATGVLTRERAHKAIDWKIIITVAAAFGLSTAMTNTKVADIIGRAITNLAISTNTGELGVLAVVMIFTEILCALITAKAGALLMFPIGAAAAARLGIDPTRMIIALMLGSSDYTTPQGHQTNLMVLGPGGYVFVDYQKLGIPLEVFLNVVQLVCLAYNQVWWFTTIGALIFLLGCIVVDHAVVERLPIRDLVPSCLTCCCRRKGAKANRDSKHSSQEEDDVKPQVLGDEVSVNHSNSGELPQTTSMAMV
jgi:di/tricarboxylate transporter